MMRVTDMIDESFDYIRSPLYAFPITIFCVGMGLTTLAVGDTLANNPVGRGLLLVGGLGLSVWSFSQFYILSLNKR